MNKPVSFYALRYAIYYIAIIAAAMAVLFAASVFEPLARLIAGGGWNGLGIVTMIVPPMLVAQQFYKHEQRKMRAREGWLMALVFTAIAFLLSLVSLWIGVAQTMPIRQFTRELSQLFNELGNNLLVVAGLGLAFVLLNNKLMLWAGIRGEIKKANRVAGKKSHE